MITVERILPNVTYSVHKYYATTSYLVGVTTAILTQHHPGLVIREGYPDDLVALASPTFAICSADEARTGQVFFGEDIVEDAYQVLGYGFVVKQGRDIQQKRYRDRLANDVYQLGKRAQETGIVLYDHASKAEIGDLEVSRAALRLLPSNAPEHEADRYKFLLELEVEYA